jgi:hypothetical protein
MTKRPMPWSLKGVSTKARDAAKSAAADAGVPMGEWLSSVIREIAAAERLAPGAAPTASAAPPGAASGPRLSSIERAMSRQGGGSS